MTARLREVLKLVKELNLYTAEEYAKLDQIAYPAGSESSEKEGMI